MPVPPPSDHDLAKFLEFQSKQNGIATPSDAAAYCQTSKTQIQRWADRGRLKTFVHCGRRYYGMDSLRDWCFFRRQLFSYGKELKTPENVVPRPIPEPSGKRFYTWPVNRDK